MKNTNPPHIKSNTKKISLPELAGTNTIALADAAIEEDKYSLKSGIKAFYTALKR